ncbi:MAG: flagellar biosynthesis protein FlhB [Acidobacteriota bacterium]|nr:MAG: flagellar biosynthesis protein FlhB [Acidobacteriota bacterium]
MAGQPDKHQRTEKPTGRRVNKAYEKGNVPRSADVSQVVQLAVFLGWALIGGTAFLTGVSQQLRGAITEVSGSMAPGQLLDSLESHARAGMLLLAPLFAIGFVFAIVAQITQTGFHPRKQPIPFQLQRLNPVNGIKQVFSLEKIVQALKAILRVALYAGLATIVLVPEWNNVVQLALVGPGTILQQAASMALRVLSRALLLSLALAVFDYAFTRYRWYRKLYMTKQEVRDETRQSEGDPLVKSRIRSRQREAARRRMMADVQKADVVVTNPVHVAVALQYERETMQAPIVLAKGRGYIALRIKEEAQKHRVPIVEDPPLARTLERICPLGLPIPEPLYRAVAEVLAYVMGRRKGAYKPQHEFENEPSATGRRR